MKTFFNTGQHQCADDLKKLMCFLMDVQLTRRAASRKRKSKTKANGAHAKLLDNDIDKRRK